MDENRMDEKGFDTWAIVELFGHSKIAGRVTEQQIAGGMFLRVDVPGDPGFTRFYGASAIYSMTPVDEAVARRASEVIAPKPVTVWGVVVPERQLAAPDLVDDDEMLYPEVEEEIPY